MTPNAAPRARRRPCLRDVKDIRSFIAALPPFDNASLAARRTSYDRAAYLFPLPEDVTVETI
jgi:hypothetical protein